MPCYFHCICSSVRLEVGRQEFGNFVALELVNIKRKRWMGAEQIPSKAEGINWYD